VSNSDDNNKFICRLCGEVIKTSKFRKSKIDKHFEHEHRTKAMFHANYEVYYGGDRMSYLSIRGRIRYLFYEGLSNREISNILGLDYYYVKETVLHIKHKEINKRYKNNAQTDNKC